MSFLLAVTAIEGRGPCFLYRESDTRFPTIAPTQTPKSVLDEHKLPITAIGTDYTEDPYRVVQIHIDGPLPEGWIMMHYQSLNAAAAEAVEPLLPDLYPSRRPATATALSQPAHLVDNGQSRVLPFTD